MNIVYFYSEVMGYTMSVIKSLVLDHGAKVHVVYWDKKRNTPFQLPVIEGVQYYKRSDMTTDDLKALLGRVNPDILYISGRMDQAYLRASVGARKKGTVVVSGFDAKWKSSFKNYILVLGRYFFYQRYFDYIWLPGPFQYEFAKKLGYSKSKILWNLYTADTTLFARKTPRTTIRKQFLYVGRFSPEKGIDVLIDAFIQSKKLQAHDWKLLMIGNGPMREAIPVREDITVLDFLQPEQLAEKTQDGGVFVLPSRNEAWGVVLHEYAAAAFPLISSDACGGYVTFVKNQYNGFVFENGNIDQLAHILLEVVAKSPEQLLDMSKRSQELSQFITPQASSASLVSAIAEIRCHEKV